MKKTEKKYIVLLGHPGAGKTTTMIKMAAWEWKYERSVAVATMEFDALGIEKVRRFAERMNTEFIEIYGLEDIDRLKAMDSHDRIYIGGAGIAIGDKNELQRAIEMLTEIGDNKEVYFVISSTCSKGYVKKYFEFMKEIKPEAIILTHLDETGDYRIQEIEELTGVEVRYLSTGNRVPVDFVERIEHEKQASMISCEL